MTSIQLSSEVERRWRLYLPCPGDELGRSHRRPSPIFHVSAPCSIRCHRSSIHCHRSPRVTSCIHPYITPVKPISPQCSPSPIMRGPSPPHTHWYYVWIPIFTALVWEATILAMLITWLAQGRPKYVTMDGSIAYISDVGADILKPLFIVGCSITGVGFALTLMVERWLRHKGRCGFGTPPSLGAPY